MQFANLSSDYVNEAQSLKDDVATAINVAAYWHCRLSLYKERRIVCKELVKKITN